MQQVLPHRLPACCTTMAPAPGGGGTLLPLLLLLGTLAASTAVAADAAAVAVFELPPADALERGKSSLDKWAAQAAASERGLVNALLGNTCFTTAVAALNQQCSQLSNEQRCWLALQFTVCFQRASGFKVLDCPAACPRRRSLQSCVEECTGRMDDKAQITYTQFFGDVLNMCLFLQTQNFQQVTAALVQDMHVSTAAANSSLAAIQAGLSTQAHALAQSQTALSRLQASQSEVASAVQSGLQEVRAVRKASAQLQGSVNTSLEMTGVLSSRQQRLLQGISTLEQQHEAHAARAAAALTRLVDDAAALEARQARYEALQARLLNASESLLGQSDDMSGLLRLLMQYQAAAHSLLSTLHSTSTSLRDVVFYAAALTVPLVFWTHPADTRLLLLAGVLGTWACERTALQHYVLLRRLFLAGNSSGSSGGAGGGVQDIKLAVRVLVLGSTLGATLWLLARRRAAQHRREAVFQAIQHALEEARLRWQAAAGLGQHSSAPGACPDPAAAHQHLQALLDDQPLLQHPPAMPPPGGKAGGRSAAAAAAAAAALATMHAQQAPGHNPLPLPLHNHHHHQQQQQQPGPLLTRTAPLQADEPPPALPGRQRAATQVVHAPRAAAPLAAAESCGLHAGQSGGEAADVRHGGNGMGAAKQQQRVRGQTAAAAAAPAAEAAGSIGPDAASPAGPFKGGRTARTAASPQTPAPPPAAAVRQGSGGGRASSRASGRKRPAAAAAETEEGIKGAEPRPSGQQSKRQR